MNRQLPPWVSEYRDHNGHMRLRFRRRGSPVHYFKNMPGTDEFWQEYMACKDGVPIQAGAKDIVPGTFNDLISQYYRSVQWRNIPSSNTRYVYRNIIERFRADYGSRRVATMSPLNIMKLMEKMADRPAAARNLLKRLKQLFDYAILLEMRKDNPTASVKAPSLKVGGHHTWTEDEIAKFEAAHPIGTRARLALCLMLYTAQRRSDIHAMGRDQFDEDGRIRVRQLKTKKMVRIPVHPVLRKALDACPSGKDAFIVSARGEPYTAESFSNWFRKMARQAGLSECPAHGLRKAASRRMAELGLSNQLIKSITGHTSDAEIARYTRDADQVAMADKAMSQMAQGLATPRDLGSQQDA
jgi:integrase